MSSNRKKIIIVIIIYIFIVSLPFTFLNKSNSHISIHTVDMENGIMDLSSFDFNDSIALRGSGLECFPNELLSPGQIENRTGTIYPSSPDIPSLTTRIQIIVPEDREYMIFLTSTDFCSKIYVNGEFLDEIGIVGDNYDNTTPKTKFCYYSVYPIDGKIEIIEQSANYYHTESSGHRINIGLPETVKSHIMKIQFDSILRIVIFFTIFLIHLGYFMFYPKTRTNLYFSLLALMFAMREGLTGIKIWSSLFSNASWFVLYRAEYLSLCLICTLLILFLNSFFSNLLHKNFLIIMSAWNMLYAFIVLFTRPIFFTGLLKYYQIGLFIGILYIVIRVIWTIRRYSIEQYILIAGLAVFFYGTIEDILFYQGPIIRGIFGGNGAGTGLMCCIFIQMLALFFRTQRDINEAKDAMQRLELENNMLDRTNRIKTEFLGNISHELKTPLTVIGNYTELSRLHVEKGEVKDDYIIRNMKLVTSETERLSLMVSQLLDMAHIEDSEMKWNFARKDLSEIITKTINIYFPALNKNHNKIETMIEDNLPQIYVDEDRIIQVIVNLIANAIRSTKHGVITIGARLSANKCDIEIYVQDTGVGMNQNQIAHLFERFYTNNKNDRHSTGTGLGLFICKSIIEAHKGTINVQSEENKGTIFICTLPINNEVN